MTDEVSSDPPVRRRAAVLGHPIAHSLSPVLHQAAYAALGLSDWSYQAIDVDESQLPGFLSRCGPGWAGWSLTMPLKRAIRPHLVRESHLAHQVGAVNTVLVTPQGLAGFNTDVHGIVAALRECGVVAADGGPPRRSIVVGGGATASSALAALKEIGCSEPVVHVRSPARSAPLCAAAERLGVRVRLLPFEIPAMIDSVGSAELVICTLPAGASDALVRSGLAEAARAHRPVLLDIVYDPWPTALAAAWQQVGAPVVGGFVMLLHQAHRQVQLMTGQRPPLAPMRAAGEAELQRRQRPLTPR